MAGAETERGKGKEDEWRRGKGDAVDDQKETHVDLSSTDELTKRSEE